MGIIKYLAADRRIRSALSAFTGEADRVLELAIAIQQIPSPTFHEAQRAAFVEDKFRRLGLADVGQDELNNVYARYRGEGVEGPVVVSAHTDTVFPSTTDLTVRHKNGLDSEKALIYGPGLADNAMGVAGILALAEMLTRLELRPSRDIWFVANVGEEGLGDLRGMRAVVQRFPSAAVFIVVEGGSFGHVFHQGIGVQRYRIDVSTPGGHSWGDFGSPSAVHVLSQIVADIAHIPRSTEPKTTYNVGVIEGGTTVNTIAAAASGLVDVRSTSATHLKEMVHALERLVDQGNMQPGVHVNMKKIGDRPAGELARGSKAVRLAGEALKVVGWEQVMYMAGSTDANIPLSLGLPAVCIGLATSGNTHRLDEFLDPTFVPQGLSQLLLLALAMAGLEA